MKSLILLRICTSHWEYVYAYTCVQKRWSSPRIYSQQAIHKQLTYMQKIDQEFQMYPKAEEYYICGVQYPFLREQCVLRQVAINSSQDPLFFSSANYNFFFSRKFLDMLLVSLAPFPHLLLKSHCSLISIFSTSLKLLF